MLPFPPQASKQAAVAVVLSFEPAVFSACFHGLPDNNDDDDKGERLLFRMVNGAQAVFWQKSLEAFQV
jgi:hypothetical protein